MTRSNQYSCIMSSSEIIQKRRPRQEGELLKRRGQNNVHAASLYQRVLYSEKYLSRLCRIMSDYTNLSASLRDKNDEVAKCLAKFASEEKYHTTAKLALTIASEVIASVGDHRNAHVRRLESKVLSDLSSYGYVCKHLKFDIRNAISAHQRETTRRKDLHKCTERKTDKNITNIMSIAEGEFEKAIAESSRLGVFSQDQMVKFERKRAKDLKENLKSFLEIEIALHAKAIELFSQAFLHIEAIDPEADIEVLIAGMKLKETKSNTKKPKPESKSKHAVKLELNDDSSCDSETELGEWKDVKNKGILKNIFDDLSESDTHVESDQSEERIRLKIRANQF